MDQFVEDRLLRLADHDVLAKKIWCYYVETLKSDGLMPREDNRYEWDNLHDGSKDNFVDAIRTHVCDTVLKLIDRLSDLDADFQIVKGKEAKVSQQYDPTRYACYTCSVRKATRFSSDGTIPLCGGCSG